MCTDVDGDACEWGVYICVCMIVCTDICTYMDIHIHEVNGEVSKFDYVCLFTCCMHTHVSLFVCVCVWIDMYILCVQMGN